MVLRVDVVAAALEAAYGGEPPGPVIALTPKGRPLTQPVVEELAALPAFTLLSSRLRASTSGSSSTSRRMRCRSDRTSSRTAISRRCSSSTRSRGGCPVRWPTDRASSRAFGGARRRTRVSALHAAGGVQRLAGSGRAALGRPRARGRLAAGAGEMSDDWGGHRRELGDEGGEKDDAELGQDDPGGWPQDEPDAGDSQGGWSDPGSTWPQPAYGEEPRDWERRPDYGDSGYIRSDEPLFDDERAEPREAEHTRRSARPALSRPATQCPGHARLDPHHRGSDPDRARTQGVGRQPVPHPVVVDGADAELREGSPEPGLPRRLERPRARLPHLPRLRSGSRPAATSWSSTRPPLRRTTAAKAALS